MLNHLTLKLPQYSSVSLKPSESQGERLPNFIIIIRYAWGAKIEHPWFCGGTGEFKFKNKLKLVLSTPERPRPQGLRFEAPLRGALGDLTTGRPVGPPDFQKRSQKH